MVDQLKSIQAVLEVNRLANRLLAVCKNAKIAYNVSMAVEYKKLVLKAHQENRILNGEFWAYDNEIRTPLASLAAGELVQLCSADGRYIATGYVNPASIMPSGFFRAIRRSESTVISLPAGSNRPTASVEKSTRTTVITGWSTARPILPGLVIDRFDDYFIVQITTAGMEKFKGRCFPLSFIDLHPAP